MKKYDFEKIDKLVQPLMEMMSEEFPNNCELHINSRSAEIVYIHQDMIFLKDEFRKTICETEQGKMFAAKAMDLFEEMLKKETDGEETEDAAAD